MTTELCYEDHGNVTIYECEHITAGTYRYASFDDAAASLISTGDRTAVLLCVHCATHLQGQVLAPMVAEALSTQLNRQGEQTANVLMDSDQYHRLVVTLILAGVLDERQRETVTNVEVVDAVNVLSKRASDLRRMTQVMDTLVDSWVRRKQLEALNDA